MSNWWEEIPEDDPILESKARALSNALAHLPGTRATKIKWCLENVPLIEAEADASGRDRGRQRSGEIRRLAIRWWRNHWAKQSLSWRDREVYLSGRDKWQAQNPWFKNEELDPGLERTEMARRALQEMLDDGKMGHEDGFWEAVDARFNFILNLTEGLVEGSARLKAVNDE